MAQLTNRREYPLSLVLSAIVRLLDFLYNPFTMFSYAGLKVLDKLARRLVLGAGLVGLPVLATASTIPVTSSFSLAGLTGTISASYDDSFTPLVDHTGTYVDNSDGLLTFDVTYNGTTYHENQALTFPTLPELLLPGNTLVKGGGYGFLGAWLVSGSIADGDAVVLGVANNVPAFLASGVSAFSAAFDSNKTLNIGITDKSIILATPEPSALPVGALALGGLWFFRRRKAIQS